MFLRLRLRQRRTVCLWRLAAQYGVSLPLLKEAVRSMAKRGFVCRRPGSGEQYDLVLQR